MVVSRAIDDSPFAINRMACQEDQHTDQTADRYQGRERADQHWKVLQQ